MHAVSSRSRRSGGHFCCAARTLAVHERRRLLTVAHHCFRIAAVLDFPFRSTRIHGGAWQQHNREDSSGDGSGDNSRDNSNNGNNKSTQAPCMDATATTATRDRGKRKQETNERCGSQSKYTPTLVRHQFVGFHQQLVPFYKAHIFGQQPRFAGFQLHKLSLSPPEVRLHNIKHTETQSPDE